MEQIIQHQHSLRCCANCRWVFFDYDNLVFCEVNADTRPVVRVTDVCDRFELSGYNVMVMEQERNRVRG